LPLHGRDHRAAAGRDADHHDQDRDVTTAAETAALAERPLPPVIEIGATALALAIAGVIYLSSFVPEQPDLGPAIGLLAGAALLVLTNALLLARVKPFAWGMFFRVGFWTLVGYAVIAGMLMYTFIYDALPTRQLTLMVVTLAVFA